MKQIICSNGMTTLVDDDDFERLSRYKWSARKTSKGYRWYAYRHSGIAMHRDIMGLKKGDKRQVDHRITEDTLNNQKSNLRVATGCQNEANRPKNKNNTSGFKGVSWHKKKQKWGAWIGVDNKSIWLGWFSSAEVAHQAYCKAAARMHGEFARTA